MMKFVISPILLTIGFLSACSTMPSSPLLDTVSAASYGSVTSRAQFRTSGNRLKVSFEVAGIDTTTGPTFEFNRLDGDTIIYQGAGSQGTATVSAISDGSVTITWPNAGTNATSTFTPRGRNLGAQP
ncbi:MAG: hypothetical protein ACRCY4_03535 [Brevinema sp.]